ncbi:MAG: uroporphyrinogen-III synthase, partial [Merismopedia sp. SIO2A8]|nr:uroporphyrinogen-III synthase [Merismopedia sp. SIO2A8]
MLLPLQGQTVLVTRATGQSGEFSDRLQSQGATVIEMPALEIGPPSSWDAFDEAIAQLETFDWLILTSANGVNAFFDRLPGTVSERSDFETPNFEASGFEISGFEKSPPNQDGHLKGIKIAVVGKKTTREQL